jgi:SAM-dependent methyltransferase
VIDGLGLDPAARVLELGPGPGYFSVELARRLPEGRLALFDLQPEMLDKARSALARAGCHDVDFHSGDASDEFPFPTGPSTSRSWLRCSARCLTGQRASGLSHACCGQADFW